MFFIDAFTHIIFSIYKTYATSDYLQVKFSDDQEWMEFIDMIKSRSVKDFGVNVSKDSKILTLSTCAETRTKRLVIHAVMIE